MHKSSTSRNLSKNLEKYKVKIKTFKLWKKTLIKNVEKDKMNTVFEMKKALRLPSECSFSKN